MKEYKNFSIMPNDYGILIYTLYKAGVIDKEQLIKLNNIPRNQQYIVDVFDIIDETFKEGD